MELGEKLRQARETKELSLQDVQEKTKIQKRYLEAIEAGNLSILPGSFYTRAFIREFALVVGLNPDELLEEHASELPSSKEEEFERLSRVQKHNKGTASNKNSAIFSVIPKVLTALLIIGIVGVVWYSLQKEVGPENDSPSNDSDEVELERSDEAKGNNEDNLNDSNDQPADSTDEPSDSQDEIEPEPEPEPELEFNVVEKDENGTPSAVVELENVGETLTIKVETENNSWLDIKNASNKVFYSDDFSNDESPRTFEFKDETEIRLNIGRAIDLKVTVNDVVLEYPFDSTQPKYYHQIVTLKLVK